MDVNEDVDFDFFDTPRNNKFEDGYPRKTSEERPPKPASAHGSRKYGDVTNNNTQNFGKPGYVNAQRSSDKKSEDYYSDDTFSSSGSEKETPRYKAPEQNRKPKQEGRAKKIKEESSTESSSAYSNSDYSSDDSETYEKPQSSVKKEKIDIQLPKAYIEAWADGDTHRVGKARESKQNRYTGKKNGRRERSLSQSESSDSESEFKSDKHKISSTKDTRNGKDKSRERPVKDNGRRKPLKSASSSYSNNSDITDVSPLESPETSPRPSRKVYKEGKENGKYKDVQYEDSSSPDRGADIRLETDQIDLSILMKCMADIDREKQERLKANSRRVMFAPPAASDKSKGNYTFSQGRAKMIEKENQRLLKQIMMQMNSSTGKKAPGTAPRPRGTKKAFEPVQRLTPSAVNRMREQRRIEAENMHMLSRLQTVRASPGMARYEQIAEAERQMSYGIPSGTVIVQGQRSHYDTMSQRSLQSSMGQRSRPSSAKSNTSVTVTPGKRSRPSSAKSNASVMSNASMRSNVSKRSTGSVRSNISMVGVRRMADGRVDRRPEWDDRFSYS